MKGQEIHCGPLEVEEGIARHSGRRELVDRNYEEHCASIPSDGRSEQFEENVQLDVTILAMNYSIDPSSVPEHSALAPVSNVAVRMEKIETAVDNRRETTLLQLEIAEHQEA
jgi:hypothetical protein